MVKNTTAYGIFALIVGHLCVASCEPTTFVEMIPNEDERIVDEGTFDITCRIVLTNYVETTYTYDRNVKWTLPDVYRENEIEVWYIFFFNAYLNIFK